MAATKNIDILPQLLLAAAAVAMLLAPVAEARITGSLTIKGYTQLIKNSPDANQADVVPGTDGTANGFGSIRVWDLPFRKTAATSSAQIGRLRGLEALTSQDEPSASMSDYLTFLFNYGGVNGTIIVHGTTSKYDTLKPLAMLGGTGPFELARGKVTQQTVSETTDTSGAIHTVSEWKFTFFQERVGVDLKELQKRYSDLVSSP